MSGRRDIRWPSLDFSPNLLQHRNHPSWLCYTPSASSTYCTEYASGRVGRKPCQAGAFDASLRFGMRNPGS